MGARHEPTIVQATSEAQIAAARGLFQRYQESLGLDLSFQGFAEELAALPGAYAPPRGRLLLAVDRGRHLGCVALRPLDTDRCEMKRLHVDAAARGRGLGRLLVEHVIREANAIGYATMLLDTLPQMQSAQRLYDALGFREIAPYRFNPVSGTRFMALELRHA